jgi:hypothetical protein
MKAQIVVSHISDTYGFGVTTDTFEQVYIPASIVKRVALNVDNICDVIVKENMHDRSGDVPWFAVHLNNGEHMDNDDEDDLIDDDDFNDPQPSMSLEDMVMSIITSADRPISTNTILHRLLDEYGHRTTTQTLGRFISLMHERGDVARACIKQSSDQRRASFVLWALTTYDFMGDAA